MLYTELYFVREERRMRENDEKLLVPNLGRRTFVAFVQVPACCWAGCHEETAKMKRQERQKSEATMDVCVE